MTFTVVVLCTIVGAVLNRFSGFTNIDWLPGRNVYYALLAVLGLSWTFFGPFWAFLITLSAGLYRVPGWYKSLDMGVNEGNLVTDATIMFARGLFFAPLFVYAFFFNGVQYALAYLVFASVAATLAYIAGNYLLRNKVKDPFIYIEALAGAAFGAAVGGVMMAVTG